MSRYVINPDSGRPIRLYGKQYNTMVKKTVLKHKIVDADVIRFQQDEDPKVIERVKQAMPKKTGRFIANYKNKLISKNNKLSTEQLLEYICEHYPNILEQSLDVIDENDDDDSIKKKFSDILHNKLMSG